MPRYFIEVSYKGTVYSGFQSQQNANTVQAEVEKAINILFHLPSMQRGEGQGVRLTGSSRTDTGVHALQNFFHLDYEKELNLHFIYKLNAILPEDIVIKAITLVSDEAHCRFDAISRRYNYHIYRYKDPFIKEQAFFFPYKLDMQKLQQAAAILKEYNDFTSFSKRNTQVKTFQCQIIESNWLLQDNYLVYNVKANRFLRGMVRALTATMLKVGREKISIEEFRDIIEAKDCTKASFAVPAHGLFLMQVEYPKGIIN